MDTGRCIELTMYDDPNAGLSRRVLCDLLSRYERFVGLGH